DGRVRVLDFGLVRLARDAGAPAEEHRDDIARAEALQAEALRAGHAGALTATGDCVGTLAYMAPEQWASSSAADAGSDEFSFCVSLWEAIFGARPGSAAPAVSAPIPARLAAVLERGLVNDPRARWASMDLLLDELAELCRPTRRWRLLA